VSAVLQNEHRTLSGDGTVTAQVLSQSSDSQSWAGAGLMVKDGIQPGARYAAIMVTHGHGVRLGANFGSDRAGAASGAPRWLRLVRAGTTITGYESADGTSWHRVGTVTVAVDANGESVHETGPREWRARIGKIPVAAA